MLSAGAPLAFVQGLADPLGSVVGGAPAQARAEDLWLKIGRLAMSCEDWEKAVAGCETALKLNPASAQACYMLAASLHQQQQFIQATEMYHRLLALLAACSSPPSVDAMRGEVWASLGHCALMLDDLPKAFSAFQQSLQHLGPHQNGTIWFFIGILYDRYGADELACEAFLTAYKMEAGQGSSPTAPPLAIPQKRPPTFREREIYFRLGILYRHRKRWAIAAQCLEYAIDFPPVPLGKDDVRFELALTHGLQGEFKEAKVHFEAIIEKDTRDASNAAAAAAGSAAAAVATSTASPAIRTKSKIILIWLATRDYIAAQSLHAERRPFETVPEYVETALKGLRALIEENPSDALGWYVSARIHVLAGSPAQAYEAYQQAVYRDGNNAGIWNSIGVLYYDIQQYRDALDAFSRAIHLAPSVGETWWNLGVLYEACDVRQIDDAIDAYGRAAELDFEPGLVAERTAYLKAKKARVLAEPCGQASVPVADEEAPKLVEYCPMPFVPRITILGNYQIPIQAPALAYQQQQQQPHYPHMPPHQHLQQLHPPPPPHLQQQLLQLVPQKTLPSRQFIRPPQMIPGKSMLNMAGRQGSVLTPQQQQFYASLPQQHQSLIQHHQQHQQQQQHLAHLLQANPVVSSGSVQSIRPPIAPRPARPVLQHP